LAIWIFFPSKSGEFGSFFPLKKKPLYGFKSYFLGRSLAKFRQKQRKAKKHWRKLVPDASLVLFLGHKNCFYLI
jgi:hypothetical protein